MVTLPPHTHPALSKLIQVNVPPSENGYNKLVSLETGVFAVRRMSSVKQHFIPQDNSILYIIIVKSRFRNRTPV